MINFAKHEKIQQAAYLIYLRRVKDITLTNKISRSKARLEWKKKDLPQID